MHFSWCDRVCCARFKLLELNNIISAATLDLSTAVCKLHTSQCFLYMLKPSDLDINKRKRISEPVKLYPF